MLKKLLAAVVAATFMVGTAMGGDWNTADGDAFVVNGGSTANDLPLTNRDTSVVSGGSLTIGVAGTPAAAVNNGTLSFTGGDATTFVIITGSTLTNSSSGTITFDGATAAITATALAGNIVNSGIINFVSTAAGSAFGFTGTAGIDNSGTLGVTGKGINFNLGGFTAGHMKALNNAIIAGNKEVGE